jgi:hypothetical protein
VAERRFASHASLRGAKPCAPSPFTPVNHVAARHCRPSFWLPTPFTPSAFTAARDSAALHSRPSICRSSLPPFIGPHGQPPLIELHLVQRGGVSATTPDHVLIDLQLTSVMLLTRQLSLARQPATLSSWNRTPTDHVPVALCSFTPVEVRLGQLRSEQPLPTGAPSNSGTPKNTRSSRTSFASHNCN